MLLESRMMRKYHVRFGGGMMEKELKSHLASFPPYFLALDKKYREQELEQGLIDHIQNFLKFCFDQRFNVTVIFTESLKRF